MVIEKRTNWRLFHLILIAALSLSGCQSAVTSQISQRISRFLSPPPPEVRCWQSVGGAADELTPLLAKRFEKPDLDPSQIDWNAAFRTAAREAGIRFAQPDVTLIPGNDHQHLALVTLCDHVAEPKNLYVIDSAISGAWWLGTAHDYVDDDTFTARWQDGMWLLVLDMTSQFHHVRYDAFVGAVVVDQEGNWQLMMASPETEATLPLPESVQVAHNFDNPDGFDRMMLFIRSADGLTTQSVYEWAEGFYIYLDE